MPTYFTEIILDRGWYSSHSKEPPAPKSSSKRPLANERGPAEILFYGDERKLRHVRVVYESPDEATAMKVVDENIAFWRDAIAATSAIATSFYVEAENFTDNSSLHIVIGGAGDATAPFGVLHITGGPKGLADYSAVAKLMAAWRAEFSTHLYFLARFLNPHIPLDMRWLQGYRLIEWHFLRGEQRQIGKDQAYLALLEAHGELLDEHKRPEQSRVTFLSRTRASIAHGIVVRAADEAERTRQAHAASNSFRAMERLVLALMNECAAEPGIEFGPRPLPAPRTFGTVLAQFRING